MGQPAATQLPTERGLAGCKDAAPGTCGGSTEVELGLRLLEIAALTGETWVTLFTEFGKFAHYYLGFGLNWTWTWSELEPLVLGGSIHG